MAKGLWRLGSLCGSVRLKSTLPSLCATLRFSGVQLRAVHSLLLNHPALQQAENNSSGGVGSVSIANAPRLQRLQLRSQTTRFIWHDFSQVSAAVESKYRRPVASLRH